MKNPGKLLDSYGGFTSVAATATGFFSTRKIDGRWWLVTPEGNGFISIGMNHFDLSVLKYPDNIHIWRKRYGGSEDRYIQEGIAQPLLEWGFNTIGWTEESVSGEWMDPDSIVRHSPEWSHRQLRLTGMPYCHSLHFVDIEDFNMNPHYPDVYGYDFRLWADYVARKSCVDMAEDPYLVGYCLSPRPAFLKQNHGSWADGLDLATGADLAALRKKVTTYYKVVTESIRRYDQNHLILGNRFGPPPTTADWFIEAACGHVDAILANWWMSDLSSARGTLDRWHELSGKPILVSDTAFLGPTELRPDGGGRNFLPSQRQRGEAYRRFAGELLAVPYIVGWHWCAYIENRARKSGIRSYLDEPYWDFIDVVKEFNTHIEPNLHRLLNGHDEEKRGEDNL